MTNKTRKTRNNWTFITVEIFLAGASEVGYLNAMKIPTYGNYVRKGHGRSPKQAYKNSFDNIVTKGNVDTSTILSDTVYLKNGKVVIRSEYSDYLIADNGKIGGKIGKL